MPLLDRITSLFRSQPETKPVRAMGPPSLEKPVMARYDSQMATPENARHWQWADYLSADSALHPDVRITIRSQARYEIQENNAYGKGIAHTLVNDTIGTGPRIQVLEFSLEENQRIERAFHDWAVAIGLRDKLYTMRMAKLVDGEAVARFINNISVDDPVSLDLQLIECDQLSSPKFQNIITETYVDGVRLDRFGNPVAYDILRHHPGSQYWTAIDYFAYDTYPQSQILHLFRVDRPGQHRGVSEFAAALPLFALLRRFTLATVTAAETAANVSQVVSTDAVIPEELEDEYAAATFEKYMDTIPVDRNSATVLPNQWKLQQFAPEHPQTTYPMFKKELVAEIGRTIGMPVNVATADSRDVNYSSARFNHLGYERLVKTEQDYLNRTVNDRIFAEWLIEAALVGVLNARVRDKVLAFNDRFGRRGLSNHITHAWHWDQMRDADQQDAAQAQRLRLQNGSTHRAAEYAVQGKDIEVEDAKAAESFGMSVEEYRKWVKASVFTNGNIIEAEPGGENDGNQNEEAGSESEAQTAAT